jgi:DNA polymerase-3 subunit alpha
VVLGGIVTAIRQKFTQRGEPCGFITIEDFDGSGELALFGESWGKFNGLFSEGASVYVEAKMLPRFQNSNVMDLKVQKVEYLQTVKDRNINSITISLTTDMLNDQTVDDLNQLIAGHPGKTKLFFNLRDMAGNHHVLLESKNMLVDVKHSLIEYIERNEALDYKIN